MRPDRLLVVALVACLGGLAHRHAPRSGTALADRIDALLAGTFRPGDPGAVVLVRVRKTTLLHRAYGLARVSPAVPLELDSPLRIASITKAFTAVLVLQLADAGRLSLDASVGHYLGELSGPTADIPLRALLQQRSGVRDFVELPERIDDRDWSFDDLVARIGREPLVFPPGTRWAYSNSNYVLLAAVIERVTGQSYGAELAARIFDPAGLTRARFPAPGLDGVDGHDADPAHEGGFVVAALPHAPYNRGDGGIAATAGDVARFAEALLSGRLLSPARLDEMLRDQERYGLGLFVDRLFGHRVVHHPGDWVGFSSALVTLPDDDVTVVLLSNRFQLRPRPETLALRIAGMAASLPVLEDLDVLLLLVMLVAGIALLLHHRRRGRRPTATGA